MPEPPEVGDNCPVCEKPIAFVAEPSAQETVKSTWYNVGDMCWSSDYPQRLFIHA